MDQWVQSFPPITRTYCAAALLTTAACALDVLSPFSLYFSWPLVLKGQLWRLVTNFFFFGAKFSLEFLFHMFFLSQIKRQGGGAERRHMRRRGVAAAHLCRCFCPDACVTLSVQYCRSLEEGSFRGRTADFFWLIFLGATSLTLIAPIAGLSFLGGSLTFMMVYIWARRNPFVRMNFLGLFTFSAPYLPWVLLSFSFLLGNNPMVDLLGILVGHSYYFLEDVYPRMLPSRRRLIATPRIVKWMFAPNVAPPPGADAMPRVEFEQERIIAQQIAQQQAAEQNGGLADQQPPPEEREEGIILAE